MFVKYLLVVFRPKTIRTQPCCALLLYIVLHSYLNYVSIQYNEIVIVLLLDICNIFTWHDYSGLGQLQKIFVFTVSHALKIRFVKSVNIISFIQSIYFEIFIAFQVERLDATISNRPRSRNSWRCFYSTPTRRNRRNIRCRRRSRISWRRMIWWRRSRIWLISTTT